MNTLSPLSATRSSARRSQDVAAAARAPAAQLAPPRNPQPPRPGVWRYGTQLNEQLTAAQRAGGYVDGLIASLERLKSQLSRDLTQARPDSAALEQALDDFKRRQNERQALSGGSLDAQLRLSLASPARRGFSIRGLEMASLLQAPAETLLIASGQNGAAPAAVRVGDGADEAELLRRFARALAPSGIQCRLDDGGQLLFDAAEEQYAQLAQSMTIQGGGMRLPGGVPQRARLDAQPEALDASGWKTGDHGEMRRMLQEVLQTQQKLRDTRAAIDHAITQARAAIAKLSQQDEQGWATEFAAGFNQRLNQPGDYGQLLELAPALLGISRYRVVSLLALP